MNAVEGVAGAPYTGGVRCDGGSGSCVTSITETHSVGWTVTVGLDLSLDNTDIISAGVSYSVSETSTVAIGEGGSDTCPQGNWECALAITPYFIGVSGQQTITSSCGNDEGPYDYSVNIPHIDESGNAIISVELCSCPDYEGWADPGAPQPCPSNCK